MGGPEDTLPQIADKPVGFAPIDARPVGLPLGSVCTEGLWHLTYPAMGALCRELRVVHQVDVSRLSAWAYALSTGLWVPLAFRRGGLRFFDLPTPTEGFGRPHGWLTDRSQTSLGLPRSAPVRYAWRGCLLYSGVWCPHTGVLCHPCQVTQHCRLGQPSFRQPVLTEPRRRFTRVHPSTLSLARSVQMAWTRLGRYPWLRTPPLPVTHAGIGNRLWTLAGV